MKNRIRSFLIVLALAIGMSACAYFEPAPYIDQNETMPGPGLFTGESGEYVLIVKE